MSKLLKIFVIFSILFVSTIYISNAETTNLYNNIDNDSTSSTEENDDIDPLADTNSNETTTSTYVASSPSARISTVSTVAEANLGLNNILCIILIAIGVLIILLAIAILIRLK